MKESVKTKAQLIDELEDMRQRMAESEDKYSALLGNTMDGVAVIQDEVFKSVNAAGAEITGCTLDEMIGMSVENVMPPESRGLVMERYRKRIAGEDVISGYDTRVLCKDGTVKDVKVYSSVIQHQGRPANMAIMRDISVGKRAEDALHQSEERMRIVLDNSPDLIIEVDREGTILFINRVVPGLSMEDVIGTNCYDYIEPEFREVYREAVERTFEEKQRVAAEIVGVGPEGSTSYYEGRLAPIMHGGRVVAAVVTATDITERKRAEEALKESEKRFRQLIELLPEVVTEVDTQGNLLLVNQVAFDTFGYSQEEFDEGLNVLQMVAPEERDRVIENMQRVMDGEDLGMDEYLLQRKDGTKFPSIVHANRVTDDSGNVVGLRAILLDITERKRAGEALRASEEKLRIMFESIGDGIVVVDLEVNIIQLNDAALQVLGYSAEDREDIIGRNALEFISERDKAAGMEDLAKALKTGSGHEMLRYSFATKDGGEVEAEFSAALIHDSAGVPTGFIGVVRDITERKRADEALRASEEKLRAMIESIRDGIVVTDLNGVIVEVNESVLRVHGFSGKEGVVGKAGLDLVSEKDRDRAREDAIKMIRGNSQEQVEYTLLNAAGGEFDAEFSAALFHDSAGKPAGFIGVSRDITERKRADEALREPEEKLRAMFESVGEGIIVNDLAGNIVDANEAALRMSGCSGKEELIGRSAFDFVSPKDRARAIADLTNALEAKRPWEKLDYTLLAVDGREYEATYSVSLLRDSEGNPMGIIGVVSDITERKRAEEALRVSEEKLRAMFEAVGEGIVINNLSGIILDVNEAETRMSGYSREEIIGRSGLDFVAERDRMRVMGDMMKAMEVGHGVSVVYTFVTKGGIEYEGDAHAALLRDSQGNPEAFITIIRDFTERRQAEQDLRERQEQLEQRTNQLLALQKVNASIQSTLEMREVLQQMAEAAVVNLGYDHSLIFVKREDKDVAQATAYFTVGGEGIINDIRHALSRPLLELEVPIIKGYSRVMDEALENRAMVADDLHEIANPLLTRDESNAVQEMTGARRIVNMPLFARERYMGGMIVFTSRNEVTEVEMEALRILGNQAAVAIENAHLYEEEKRLRKELSFYLHQVTIAQEEERKRIARELHDDTTQELVALSRRLDNLVTTSTKLSNRDAGLVEEARQDVDKILEGVRRFSRDLRPSVLDDLGLVPALEWLASELNKHFGIAIDATVVGMERRLSPEIELAMFRIAQEALRNTCRHARASRAWVVMEYGEDETILRISDDGKGFEVPDRLSSLAGHGKLGLAGMEERAQLMGGALSLRSSPGKGVTIIFEMRA